MIQLLPFSMLVSTLHASISLDCCGSKEIGMKVTLWGRLSRLGSHLDSHTDKTRPMLASVVPSRETEQAFSASTPIPKPRPRPRPTSSEHECNNSFTDFSNLSGHAIQPPLHLNRGSPGSTGSKQAAHSLCGLDTLGFCQTHDLD